MAHSTANNKTLKFTLPMPPSINATYRGAGGKIVYTDAAKAYRDEVQYMLNQDQSVPFKRECKVLLRVYMKYRAKGDMHNNHKLLLDLLEGHAFTDDRLVAELQIVRRHDHDNPRVEVEVWEL